MQFKDIIKRPPSIGIILGTLMLGISLTPSLIPRPWVHQAAIAALSFLSGYGVGVGINALWRYLELPSVPQQYRARSTQVLFILSGVLLVYFLFKSVGWQNSVRATVGMEPVDSTHPLRMILLAALLIVVLLLFIRFLWWLAVRTVGLIAHYIPHRYGQVIGIVIAFCFIVFLVNGVLLQAIANMMNSSYSLTDSGSYENVPPPTSPLRTGSPDSLVAWDTLGKEGRRFVGTGPSAAEISEFWGGGPATEPIRIYLGDKSADSMEEKAELVLQELLRTDAFERGELLLVTPSGNGWVDANAVDSFEYMHGGDTVVVAFQYSYLPSLFAMVADPAAATETSVAIFNKIHGYWETLDEETRPEFYLQGLSLGAFGSQAAASNVNLFNAPIDGALWAGPPFVSPFWRQITRNREPGTPIWLPVYQGGTTIRFTNTGADLAENEEEWLDNRYIYLQQADDPIVFFAADSLFRVPEWLQAGSRSPKAPPEMKWYPLVTFWQLVFDMVLGVNDTLPDGNGHRYASDSYIDSWVVLTEPENWSSAQTEQLQELFNTMPNPNKP